MIPHKILCMSDLPLGKTGYGSVTRELITRLCRQEKYDINVFAWNYGGMPVSVCPDNNTLYTSQKENSYKILPAGLTMFGQDMLHRHLKTVNPDLLWVLCDSVTEERIIPIKNKAGEIQFMPVKDVFKKYSNNPEEIEVLSAELIGKITKQERKFYNCVTKKYEERKIEIDGRKAKAKWCKVKDIVRRTHKGQVVRIQQATGQTRTTFGHSLITKTKNGYEKIKPLELIEKNRPLESIYWLNHERKLRKKHEYIIKGAPFKKLDDVKMMALMRLFGAYVSEGCVNEYKSNRVVIWSSTENTWLEKLKKDIKTVFGKTSSISGTNLVMYGKDYYNWFKNNLGKGCRNKKFPSFVFELRKEFQKEFLRLAIEGDGTFFDKTKKNKYYRNNFAFQYTTTSLTLGSQLCYLLRQIGIKYSTGYDDRTKAYRIWSSAYKLKNIKTHSWTEEYDGYIYDFVDVENTNIFVDGFGLTLLHNTFMIPYVAGLDLRNFIMYFPSDGKPLPSRSSIVLKKANYPVAMSKFAQKQAQDEVGVECDYIPHGINSANYGVINAKNALREKWSKRWKVDLKDKFLIGYVGRFQGRKMLPELLRAFAKFQKDKDDVFLILHCDPLDPAGTQDGKFSIIEVIKTLGIGRKVIFTGTHVNHGFELQEMCELYNLFDIHASATSGEGFGLTTLESMACGVPNVITDYTTSRELLDDGKCGLLTPVGAFMTGTFNVERAIADIGAMAKQFEELYNDRDRIKMFSKHCLKKVQEYDWDNVVFPAWEKKFREVLE